MQAINRSHSGAVLLVVDLQFILTECISKSASSRWTNVVMKSQHEFRNPQVFSQMLEFEKKSNCLS